MKIDLPMLKLLQLEIVPQPARWEGPNTCTRCGTNIFPRRLWNCRGLQLVYRRICIECVRWVGGRWMEHFEIMAMREWARDLGERRQTG